MEASFKSRVEQAFGALLGASSQGIAAPQLAPIASSSGGAPNSSWSVSEVAIPSNPGSRGVGESSGSESDEPCAAQYEKFVKLAKRARRRHANDDAEGFDKEHDLDDLYANIDNLPEEDSDKEHDIDDLYSNIDNLPVEDFGERRASKRSRGEEPAGAVSAENGQQDVDEEEEECRQVRLMVGMDDTLDFEEEEDEYDKVAVGREGAGERVYMREITAAGSNISADTPLAITDSRSERRKFSRDSRANHAAAAARLKEDDRLAAIKNEEVARMLKSSSSSGRTTDKGPYSNGVDNNVHSHRGDSSSLMSNIKPALKRISSTAGNVRTDVESIDALGGTLSNGAANQSALQRGGGEAGGTEILIGRGETGVRREGKSKRVRFADDDHVILDKETETVSGRDTEKVAVVSMSKNRYGRVPDHVRNPRKYTHYTLDWSDEEDDNKANLTAFQATQAITRAREEQETTGIVELPKSITFTPRSGGTSSKSNGEAKISTGAAGFQQSQALVSFAEEVLIDNSPQPEEAPPPSSTSTSVPTEAKPARVFRKRAREEEIDGTVSKDDAS